MKPILAALDKYYPTQNKCYLNYTADHELLIATILSAQCTDDRVNLVTKPLFHKYPTLEDFSQVKQPELEKIIKSAGLYRNKAKSIIGASQVLLDIFDGKMPKDINDLLKLPGVGRKTANVIRSHIFNLPSIVVDTHVKRISIRWGFTENTDPTKIEFDLMRILPRNHWIRYNTQVIAHGRSICKAPRAKCSVCFMTDFCPSFCIKSGED